MTNQPSILCVGDIDLDYMYSVGSLPQSGGKVSGHYLGKFPGGMAANTAVGFARHGYSSRMLGSVGADPEGREALAALRAVGVDTSYCRIRKDAPTFTCLVLVDERGEKTLIRLGTPAFMPEISDLHGEAFAGIDHVHTNFGVPSVARETVRLAREKGASVSLDLEMADIPAEGWPMLDEVLAEVDVLFLNEASERSLPEVRAWQPPHLAVVTTLGKDGARYRKGEVLVRVPGHPVEAVDTTGAGDCFASVFLSHYLEVEEPEECLRRANAAAALSTLTYGAQGGPPDREAVQRFLEDSSPVTNPPCGAGGQ